MIKLELYSETERPTVVIERSEPHSGAWARLTEAFMRGVIGGAENRMDVRPDVVLAELEVLREIRTLFRINPDIGPNLSARLRRLAGDRTRRIAAMSEGPIAEDVIIRCLAEQKFKRTLKPFQLANVGRLAALPHGADFSVPGAGKTTVALAVYSLARARAGIRRMLVVAPLAAFGAWKEDTHDCFDREVVVGVHLGNEAPLPSTCEILLTNYHRLASDYERIRAWISHAPTQVVLDEAHRMKRGSAGIHGSAALDLAFGAERRDVLTGTPTPQGAHDLVALVRFLFPGQERQILPAEAFLPAQGREPHVLSATNQAVRKLFVRTRKVDLDLPRTDMRIEQRPMGRIQADIYKALVGQYVGALNLPTQDRRTLRDLGLVTMYLLEAATNPLLLTAGGDPDELPCFMHPPLAVKKDTRLLELLHRYAEFERPWKYDYVKELVRNAANSGTKILVWSSFVRNLRFLARDLAEFRPAVVHGGIPPADGAPASCVTTRERELDRFRHDPQCTVLLANPAACGEGVSLHRWCHHAVYLDRTFNAGHFLQSQDRIHRLGLDPQTVTQFTILASEATIDQAIDRRLRDKVKALAMLVDDPGLVDIALPVPDENDNEVAVDDPLGFDDVEALRSSIFAEG